MRVDLAVQHIESQLLFFQLHIEQILFLFYQIVSGTVEMCDNFVDFCRDFRKFAALDFFLRNSIQLTRNFFAMPYY